MTINGYIGLFRVHQFCPSHHKKRPTYGECRNISPISLIVQADSCLYNA